MKRILIILLGLFSVAYGQFSPTSAKSAFKWGVSIGTRDSSAYAANDSLVVVINRQGRMMYRSTDGYWKILGNSSDSSAILSQVVRTFGAQNVGGVKTFTDSIKTQGVSITATADSSTLFRYPAELKTLYRENTLYPQNFGFNIVPSQSNSFFTFTEEGLAHQAYYKGDGDGNTNIWGVSSKLNTDTGWIPRMVVNQNGRVGINTNTPLVDLDVRGDAKAHTVFSNKSISGGADTLFSGDPYVGPLNTLKSGFIHHYYGISDNQNGGGDITYFKENGIDYKRLSNVADRRVLPGEEIWYEQYSAHNGVDSIYSRRSIAAITQARTSYNSTLGDMRGWYEIVTARDSGYKASPSTIDFLVSEGRMAVNAPSNSTNATFTSTANIYGDLLASNGLISNNLRLRNSPLLTQYDTYVNGSSLAFRVVGNTFDNLQVRSGARPIVVQGGSTSPPMYLYSDATGGGITMSETQLTGYYQTSSLGQFIIANNEIVRFNNAGGPRWGIGTGNTLAATLHVRGSTSSTAAFLVSNNVNADLFRVNNGGEIIANTGFTGIRGRFTSLVLNKDSVPITTTNTQVLTIDTTSGRVQRNTITSGIYLPVAANVSNTSSITIDTAQFMRVGDVVTVSGRISFTNTLNSPSQISITLPVATVVSSVRNVAGVGNENIAMKSAIIRGRTGTNDALLEVDGLNSSTYTIYYTYTYRIL